MQNYWPAELIQTVAAQSLRNIKQNKIHCSWQNLCFYYTEMQCCHIFWCHELDLLTFINFDKKFIYIYPGVSTFVSSESLAEKLKLVEPARPHLDKVLFLFSDVFHTYSLPVPLF